MLVSWRMHSKSDGTLFIKRISYKARKPIEVLSVFSRHLAKKSNMVGKMKRYNEPDHME